MRAIIKLTELERKELEKRKKEEKNSKIYRRYIYVELSSKGLTNVEISQIIGVSNDTLTDWKVLFEEKGFEGLSELHYEGRRVSKLIKYAEAMKEKIQKDNIATLSQIQNFLKEEYGVMVEQSWLSRFCKKNSIFLTRRQD